MTASSGRPAVFLDRDGTINEEYGYLNHVSRVRLLPGAGLAIARLNNAGLPVVVVSNQAGLAHGYFPEENLIQCEERLKDLLAQRGGHIDAFYYCPFHPQAKLEQYRQDSPLRKPRPGMLDKAAAEHDIDLSRSYLVGDRPSDMECARSRGLKALFVRTGYGEGEMVWHGDQWKVQPDVITATLNQAVTWILKDLKFNHRPLG